MTINVAALTGGKRVPSARFRIRQYTDPLHVLGIQVNELSSSAGQYPPKKKWKRLIWFIAALVDARFRIWLARDADLVVLQRELISTLRTVERFIKRPCILDVDDSIWLNRSESFAGKLASDCDAIICGNDFIADYFRRFNSRVYVIPTAIDTQRFKPSETSEKHAPIICWSGTSSNLMQLEWLEPALLETIDKHSNAKLRVISDSEPDFKFLDPSVVEFIQWSEDQEVSALSGATIGIMPLEENDWSRGKCAFKMLTYMACGLPVVVSPVGMNSRLLNKAPIGIGASTRREWSDALSMLIEDGDKAVAMGKAGRKLVETEYSVDVLAPRIAGVLRETYERHRAQGKGQP